MTAAELFALLDAVPTLDAPRERLACERPHTRLARLALDDEVVA